jgi:hypothetical protein
MEDQARGQEGLEQDQEQQKVKDHMRLALAQEHPDLAQLREMDAGLLHHPDLNSQILSMQLFQ